MSAIEHVEEDLILRSGTVTIFSSVRVVPLAGDAAFPIDVLKSVGWKTTVAAKVVEAACAVNELLLRVGSQSTVFDQMARLEAPNRGECPAGATLALVLNWTDSVVVTPVPLIGSVFVWRVVGRLSSATVLVSPQTEVLDELFVRHGSELVNALLVSLGFIGIVAHNILHIGLENFESLLTFEVDH